MQLITLGSRIALAARSFPGGQKGLAAEIGVHRNTLSSWISGKTSPTAKQLEALAKATGQAPGSFAAGSADGDARGDRNDIPILGTAAGSVAGSIAVSETVVDWAPRPVGLAHARDAYALFVSGSSMEPRYRPGELIFVYPGRPAVPGDIVVIQTQRYQGGHVVAYVKELVRRTEKAIVARQYNKPAEIEFTHDSITAVHRVMTVNELMGK